MGKAFFYMQWNLDTFGTSHFFVEREVKNELLLYNLKSVLCWEVGCPFLGGSFTGGSTVHEHAAAI